MILKQIFTNGTELHTDIGSSHEIIMKSKNPQEFESSGEQYYSDWPAAKMKYNIEAFLVYNQGGKGGYKILPVFNDHYNAVMTNTGNIYNVLTCMPF